MADSVDEKVVLLWQQTDEKSNPKLILVKEGQIKTKLSDKEEQEEKYDRVIVEKGIKYGIKIYDKLNNSKKNMEQVVNKLGEHFKAKVTDGRFSRDVWKTKVHVNLEEYIIPTTLAKKEGHQIKISVSKKGIFTRDRKIKATNEQIKDYLRQEYNLEERNYKAKHNVIGSGGGSGSKIS